METTILAGEAPGLISAVPAVLHGGDPLLNPPPPPVESPPPPSSARQSHDDAVFDLFDPLDDGYSEEVDEDDGDSGRADGAAASVTPSNGHNSFSRSRPPSDSAYSKIVVSDPQKEHEAASSIVSGGGAYMTYLISTRTAGDGGGAVVYRVRRRFRDVVSLADRLVEAYRGLFVPARPDKSVVEGQLMHKHEFVEQRRSALEKYLHRLAVHPVIGRSDELRAFLTAPGRSPLLESTNGAVGTPRNMAGNGGRGYAAVSTHDEATQHQPSKSGRDFMRVFRELKQSITNEWVGGKPSVEEEDKEFLEWKEKVQDLEQQLTTTSRQAEVLVKAQQGIGESMGELGLTFIKLAKFETEQAAHSNRIRASAIKRFATAAVKVSRFYRELNAQTVKHLDTLHDYLGLMLAVQSAFSDRSSALLTVQTLMSDLSSLHMREEKLEAASSKIFGGDKSRVRKGQELKELTRITEDAKVQALKEYEQIKERNRYELERLQREKQADFLEMLKGFVINQVSYAEKIASVWTNEAEETREYFRETF